MRFVIAKNDLKKAVDNASAFVPNSPLVPAIENFCLSVDESGLNLCATDLNSFYHDTLDVAENPEPGAVLVLAKLFKALLNKLPEQPLTFETDPKNRQKLIVKHMAGEYSLHCDPAEDFPKAPTLPADAEITNGDFTEWLTTAVNFASTDEFMPAMVGVTVKVECNQVVVYSTDSHRIFRQAVSAENSEANHGTYVIPSEVINKVKWKNSHVFFTTDRVFVTQNKAVISAKLVAERPPNFEDVIPREFIDKVSLQAMDFRESVDRLSLLANSATNQVVLTANKEFSVQCEDLGFGRQGFERVPTDEISGQFVLGLNAKFLEQALRVFPKEVTLNHKEKGMPVKLTNQPDDPTILLMPIMLNDYKL